MQLQGHPLQATGAPAVVNRTLDSAASFGIAALPRQIAQHVAATQDAHANNLFATANALLERTVLAPEFHAVLPDLLRKDGFDLTLLAADPHEFFEFADHLWQVLVARH